MKNDLAGLKPVERSKFYELWQREALDPALFEDDKTVLWAARALGARLAIVGTVELKGDSSFLLHVREIDVESEQIADAGEFLEWTEERRNLDLQPVAQAPPLAPWKEAARPGQQGISYPECVYCPNPPYSEEARKEGIEGTILTEVLIGEDGRVQHVRALKGLPFGLMTNALATIKTWKFKPMTGPDGKPVEVQTSVEATFRVFPHAQ